MQNYEVPTPILNSPFHPPGEYWYIREGEALERRGGRRRSVVFPPRDQRREWDLSDGVLSPAADYPGGYELTLVASIWRRFLGK